jgi:dehydrogenase/reductase SDR family protein 12
VDGLAEATVAPGFSRVGSYLRRSLEQWGPPPAMDGAVVVVTGATSGIGLATSIGLAALGAQVHLVGRDPQRGEAALAAAERAGTGRAHLHLVDLSDPAAVEALARNLADRCDRLDALVHNAGALSRTYRTTAAGVELTVATQVLGPYLLTAGLAPLLWAGGPSTIVTVSSGGMYSQRFDLADLEMGPDEYDGVVAYARAKRAQVVLAGAWAQRYSPAGVSSFSMHPGWVDTPGLEAGLPRFRALSKPLLRTPEDGADTIVWLAAGGATAEAQARGVAAPTSGFFHDRHPRSDHRALVRHPTRPGDGAALLSWCAERTGVGAPLPPLAI